MKLLSGQFRTARNFFRSLFGMRKLADGLSRKELERDNAHLTNVISNARSVSAQRDAAEQEQATLTLELHHRMKNMLTIVSAIVRQSLRTATTLEEAEGAITKRLIAMSRAQEVLQKTDWNSAQLSDVIKQAVDEHYIHTHRFSLGSRDALVPAGVVLPLTLIFSELAANASKYGAFSVPEGSVTLTWNEDKTTQILSFVWKEKNGPSVSRPERKGFGSKLIEEAIPKQLGGTATLNFSETGVTYTLAIPLETVAPATDVQPSGRQPRVRPTDQSYRRRAVEKQLVKNG
jgi:two-component sensor histidine kinase